MKKNIFLFAMACFVILNSCKESKIICKNNKLYGYINNQSARNNGQSDSDRVVFYRVDKSFRAVITPNVSAATGLEYYFINLGNKKITDLITDGIIKIDSSVGVNADPSNLGFNGKFYFPEATRTNYHKAFRYIDSKFGIQTLSVPIKIRPALSNDSLYPKQAESGFNIGFAPGIKLNYNVSNPYEKFLGKSLRIYSLTGGILFNLGTTALKKAVNAPGLNTVDKVSPIFSYGGYLVLGVNNINIGYAMGWDLVMGGGKDYWVYQNKKWHGIIVALDIIKIN